MVHINGEVKPGFERVKQALSANFEQYQEAGAACSVYFKGQLVVDIWGGISDINTEALWQQDTLELVFSAAKGITTVCMLMLVEQEKLDLDAPIANYWPEFSQNGKQSITTRMVMSHRAGLAAVDGDLTLQQIYDWYPVVNAIAAQSPNWQPGTEHGYHARSFGWILGEVLRRIEGITLGQFLQREIAEPLGLHMYIGLPAQKIPLCAPVIPPEASQSPAELFGATSLTAQVMNGPSNLFNYDTMWNDPALLQAEMPSSNAVTTAQSLAKFYAALLWEMDTKKLLTNETIRSACQVQSEGPDKVIFMHSKFGTGFALPPYLVPGVSPDSFGHPGAGGSMGFADPEAGISFGYVMNRMRFDMNGDPRVVGLVKALYQCL